MVWIVFTTSCSQDQQEKAVVSLTSQKGLFSLGISFYPLTTRMHTKGQQAARYQTLKIQYNY